MTEKQCSLTDQLNSMTIKAGQVPELIKQIDQLTIEAGRLVTPRPFDDYHEDMGAVLWWHFPIEEPPYVGTPQDSDFPWPNDNRPESTHWTPLPDTKAIQHNWELSNPDHQKRRVAQWICDRYNSDDELDDAFDKQALLLAELVLEEKP